MEIIKKDGKLIGTLAHTLIGKSIFSAIMDEVGLPESMLPPDHPSLGLPKDLTFKINAVMDDFNRRQIKRIFDVWTKEVDLRSKPDWKMTGKDLADMYSETPGRTSNNMLLNDLIGRMVESEKLRKREKTPHGTW